MRSIDFRGLVESSMIPSASSLLLASSSAQVWILGTPNHLYQHWLCKATPPLISETANLRRIRLIRIRDASSEEASKETPVPDPFPAFLRLLLTRGDTEEPSSGGVVVGAM